MSSGVRVTVAFQPAWPSRNAEFTIRQTASAVRLSLYKLGRLTAPRWSDPVTG